jgi:hypothetical protein
MQESRALDDRRCASQSACTYGSTAVPYDPKASASNRYGRTCRSVRVARAVFDPCERHPPYCPSAYREIGAQDLRSRAHRTCAELLTPEESLPSTISMRLGVPSAYGPTDPSIRRSRSPCRPSAQAKANNRTPAPESPSIESAQLLHSPHAAPTRLELPNHETPLSPMRYPEAIDVMFHGTDSSVDLESLPAGLDSFQYFKKYVQLTFPNVRRNGCVN